MTYRKIAASLVLLAGLASLAFAQQGQTTLIQTTLNGAVTGPSGYSGTTPTLQTFICLASTTGIAAPVLPGTPVSVIFVDREAMGVFQVNTTTNCVLVNRGYLSTQASPHVTGQMVLVANQYNTNQQYGGNPLPSGFYNADPPQGGTCNSGVPTIPWVNVSTGAQWLCSTITNTWVPGWNNPEAQVAPGLTASVASAAGAITPSGPYFTITGSAAVTGFNVATGNMVGFNSTAAGYGCFLVRSANGTTATWTNAGNIAIAGTFTANKVFEFCWDPNTSKFVPTTVS